MKRLCLLVALLVAGLTSTASAALPARVPDLAYQAGTCTVVKPNSVQQGDMYPSPAPGSPAVLFVHGGGWIGNNRLEFVTKVRQLQAAGITVFNIDYCLDNTRGISAFPTEVQDVEAATRYLIAHAPQYNADPNNVTLLGGSAGGQLAAMAALSLDAAAPDTVKGVVTLSGPFDFTSLMREDLAGETRSLSFARNIPRALGCTITRPKTGAATSTCMEGTETEWSPVDHVTTCPPHWLMFNSENELIPLGQEEEMASALIGAGCSVTASVEAGSGHAFAYWPTVEPTITGFLDN